MRWEQHFLLQENAMTDIFLYVKCSSGEQEWIMVITDNGQTTEKDVKEGGGLSGIRKRVEQCGGTLRICAESKFSIIVKIPKEVRR